MPKMSDTMTEGVVAKWHKKIGDTIKSGELVAEIETDKATMEFESYSNGTLLYIGVPEGKAAPVDGVLAILGHAGEDFKSLLEAEQKKVAAPVAKPAEQKQEIKKEEIKNAAAVSSAPQKNQAQQPVTLSLAGRAGEGLDSRIKISPLAKRLAEEQGIDFGKLKGTGDMGRVVKRDIDWFKPSSFVASTGFVSSGVTKESFEDIPVSQMRKTIAKRLSESKSTAPHFYLTMDIDMSRCIDARESIVAVTQTKISYNDIIIKACAIALQQHPKVNSSWMGDVIRVNHHINIGVAVAVDDGLLVPVVRFADTKTLLQINAEVKEFAQKAKDKKLQPADWEGNTFTISNLGMFDIEEFTAIINSPDSCILAVGAIKQTPVVKNGNVVVGNTMRLTLSCDHRAVDGVMGSKFLQTLKGFLENPVILLGQSSI
jgi:pyruvate dehydrogenase E2 component (dihydrolipoamide acetyltransferase)